MDDRHSPTELQQRIGILVLFMAGTVATAPLLIAVAIRSNADSAATTLAIIAALAWMVTVIVHRGLARAHEHWRRRALREEVAAARRARIDASEVFQDQLNDQHAILDRIVGISEAILAEGIIDPNLAITKVRLIGSHAREAQALVEDSITEVRVETGASIVDTETFNIRSEIEDVVAPFIRSGAKIATSGPRHYVETDPAMFRLMLRGLVAGAIERRAEEIDLTIARNGVAVVCTVSDDGPDNSGAGLDSVSPVTRSLALHIGAELDFSFGLGRNQYSLAVKGAETPEFARPKLQPMDVLGSRVKTRPEAESPPPAPAPAPPLGRPSAAAAVAFADDPVRSEMETVAARRETQLTSR